MRMCAREEACARTTRCVVASAAHSKKLPLIISQVAETNSPAPCSDGRRMAAPQVAGAIATCGLGRQPMEAEGLDFAYERSPGYKREGHVQRAELARKTNFRAVVTKSVG